MFELQIIVKAKAMLLYLSIKLRLEKNTLMVHYILADLLGAIIIPSMASKLKLIIVIRLVR